MFWKRLFGRFFYSNDNRDAIVLVVDSNRMDLASTARAVIDGGYNVLKASNGKSGLASAVQHKPDLIIFDFKLEDMPGHDFCHQLKTEAATQEIPVIVLTDVNTSQAILDAYEQGVEDYFLKPINRKFLLNEIDRVLRLTAQLRNNHK